MTELLDVIRGEIRDREASLARLVQEHERHLEVLRRMETDAGSLTAAPASAPARRELRTERKAAAPKRPRQRTTSRGERVPPASERIVAVLEHRDGATIAELAEALGISDYGVRKPLKQLLAEHKLVEISPSRGRHAAAIYGVPSAAPVQQQAPPAEPPARGGGPELSPRVRRELEREGEDAAQPVRPEQETPQELLDRIMAHLAGGPQLVRDLASSMDSEPANVAQGVRKLVSSGDLERVDDGRYAIAGEKPGDGVRNGSLASAGATA